MSEGLIPELLSADDSAEMSDILNCWQVPSVNLDLSLGSVTSLVYDGDDGDDFLSESMGTRRGSSGNKGSSGDLTRCQPVEGEESGGVTVGTIVFFRGDGGWCKGKVETVLAGGKGVLAAISPEGVTRRLRLPSTQDDQGAERQTVDMEHLGEATGEGRRYRGRGEDMDNSAEAEAEGDKEDSLLLLSMCAVSHLMTRARAKQRVLGPGDILPQTAPTAQPTTWACATCIPQPYRRAEVQMCESNLPR